MSRNDKIEIERWKLEIVEDTLRLASNIHNSPARVTCFDRNIMESWNIITDSLNGEDSDPIFKRDSYMQVPNLKSKE